MMNLERMIRFGLPCFTAAVLALPLIGCGPNYQELRRQGQAAMAGGAYGPARTFFIQAEQRKPRNAENLHDLGAASVIIARRKFEQSNYAAAMREVDAAIAYYTQAIDSHPGHQASLVGKRVALKLKGQFDEALEHAEWAAEFVGPAARQYVLLAQELEERGDLEGALLRYRQAVNMEPRNAEAHADFAKFLLRNNNEPAAVFHLQQAYLVNPADKWVMTQLAQRGAVPKLTADTDETP